MLTEAEHKAVAMLAELWDIFATEIVVDGPGREGDLREIAADIHALQFRVMAQSAARQYSGLYRLMGGPPPAEGVQNDEI